MSDDEVEALVRRLRVVATYFIGDDIVSRITSAIEGQEQQRQALQQAADAIEELHGKRRT